ncbi:uncharacterized protein EV420DRAFT_1519431 [Desarmillaria tabescens]|uniref:Retrotransposon gag domain-containing protein n=1 Tax=Armillaria tabescens TaxID=1929756 RepID=A0AA39NDW0_ARMTA|nr:uncharacterized protein EV420DRAFT_1519431 [Desarmillaria tabescens]KAK0463673.1 hypothetical protein EV420DRAFT_1519431 [Desarmillaria tabescens]
MSRLFSLPPPSVPSSHEYRAGSLHICVNDFHFFLQSNLLSSFAFVPTLDAATSSRRFTRRTAQQYHLPVFEALDDPDLHQQPDKHATDPRLSPVPNRSSSPLTELDSSCSPSPQPMSSKLDLPTLANVTSIAALTWLTRCADSFEAWSALNADKKIKPETQILVAGLKMEHAEAAAWWNENRESLKKLASWDEFVAKVKDRFVPSNWRLDALAAFYSVKHAPGTDFQSFVSDLQTARNALASAGTGYTITDSSVKNHLLFFAHPILSLRVRSTTGFASVYGTMKLDALVNLMSTTWASLIAENVVRIKNVQTSDQSHAIPTAHITSTHPTASTAASNGSRYPFPDLSYAEKEALRASGGCFHCRKTPSSPNWTQHSARNCPGDSAAGVAPRATRPLLPHQRVAGITFGDAEIPETPGSFVLDGPDSSDSDYDTDHDFD